MSARYPQRARVAVVEDHLLQRTRVEQLVDEDVDLDLVYSGPTLPSFMEWVREVPRETRPHLLVLDLMVDRGPAVQQEVVSTLVKGGLKVVVLSALVSIPLVRGVVRAGVSAIVGKRDSEESILGAIHAALRGEEWMTEELAALIAADPDRPKLSIQEERALILYASGLTIAEVSEAMGIGWETTRQYLDRIKAKYTAAGIPVKTKLDLGRIAVADGYVEP